MLKRNWRNNRNSAIDAAIDAMLCNLHTEIMTLPLHWWFHAATAPPLASRIHSDFCAPLGAYKWVQTEQEGGMTAWFLNMIYQYQYHTKPGVRVESFRWFAPNLLPGKTRRNTSPEALKNLFHNQGRWSFRCLKRFESRITPRGPDIPLGFLL